MKAVLAQNPATVALAPGSPIPVETSGLIYEDESVRVVSEFRNYLVQGEIGRRPGYVIEFEDGARVFARAGDLTLPDGKPSHLRLVRSA